MGKLVVHDWYTSCGECKYGSGGWASTQNRFGPLSPDAKYCISCGVKFTEREFVDMYKIGRDNYVEQIED